MERKITNLRDALFQTKCLLILLWYWEISPLNPRTTEKALLVGGVRKGPVLSAKSTLSMVSENESPVQILNPKKHSVLTMPHFSSRVAAETYHNAALRLAFFFTLSRAA